jgi:hypothetical protein
MVEKKERNISKMHSILNNQNIPIFNYVLPIYLRSRVGSCKFLQLEWSCQSVIKA